MEPKTALRGENAVKISLPDNNFGSIHFTEFQVVCEERSLGSM